ncbi:MAG: hypothetical protein U1G05_09715 [Kiritimatiellia bacterium]
MDLALADPVRLAGLAQVEIIRQCSPESAGEVLARENGAAFLGEFLRSPEWMESFLVSDPPAAENYAAALENLRLLAVREGPQPPGLPPAGHGAGAERGEDAAVPDRRPLPPHPAGAPRPAAARLL